MSSVMDITITIGVLAIFFYFILLRLKKKYPPIGEEIKKYFPFMDDGEEKKPIEKSEQKWTERREIL